MNETATTTWRDPRLRWAIAVAVLLHGSLLASGSFRGTYDAWVHIFFGDHYARDWFSTWEPRWYTGFTTVSYPPASHQAIGLVSKLIGLQWAFAVVQLLAVLNLVAGVYRFSLLWVSRTAAGWAALFAAVSSSLAEVVHTFGQLPTTFALGFLLHAQPSVARWVRDGVRIELVASIALLAATTAGHHVTTLFGSVFFTGPVTVRALLDRWRAPLAGEAAGHAITVRPSLLVPQVARRLRRIAPALGRTAVFGFLAICTLVTVVLPYWLWSSSDPIVQVPIPHASRNDFLTDRAAGLVFWLVPWMGILLLTPIAIIRAATSRGWPLAASIGLLALLGTGGTTPIPRMLLGDAFDILTLDRFTIWATIAILPYVGWAFESLRTGALSRAVSDAVGQLGVRVARAAVLVAVIASCVFATTLTSHRPFQPRAIDPAPIVSFLEKDDHDRWRYLTLGFGDQMAWVSANTTAQTVDGNYHSARRLPELTSRSVERLEGAKYRGIPGLGSLQQFLNNPSPYHLKFVFSIDRFYDPLLWATGWQRIGTLDNDVEVWERADVPPLPDVLPVREIPGWQRLSWGLLPLLSVAGGVATLLWFVTGRRRPRRLHPLATPRPGAGRLLRHLDRRLAQLADRLHDHDDLRRERLAWEPLLGLRAHGRRLLAGSTGRRLARAALALAFAGTAAVAWGAVNAAGADTPEARLASYYDALDVQRFDAAHGHLDPETRPVLADYLVEISLRDGLLAGYAELDAVRSSVVTEGDTATAEVELTFVTSVAEYRVDRSHDLVRRDGTWFLVPETPVPSPPSSGATTRTEVEVALPSPSTGATEGGSFDQLLDRPTVDLGRSTVYRSGEAWIVVGSLTNRDAVPADATISATLRDADGEVLARYDAGQATIKRVLPGERVSFRIDVEGRAGSYDRNDPNAGDFDPLAYSAPVLDDDVAVVEVSARAVATGGGAERDVGVAAATVDDIGTVEAALRNDASTPATIARVTTTYLDAEGAVVWVDHHWAPESVLPRSSTSTSWRLADVDVDRSDVLVEQIDDVPGDGAAFGRGPGSLALPADLRVADRDVEAVRLDVTSFTRSAQP